MKKLRRELQVEFGECCINAKADGLFTDNYVYWLEKKVDELNKDRGDALNWAKSELIQESNDKLGKTMSPYRSEKVKFLRKIVKRFGSNK